MKVVKLTPGEVTRILKEHFKQKGVNVETVHYKLGVVPDPDDWRCQYPASEELSEIICIQIEEHEDTTG